MDGMITELLKASPAAAAMIIIVMVFMNHMERRDLRQEQREEAADARYDELLVSLQRNTEEVRRNTDAIQKVNVVCKAETLRGRHHEEK